VSLGIGACLADLTYVILLCIGILPFLNHPLFLQATGIIGAFILAWFGVKALQQKSELKPGKKLNETPLLKTGFAGYILTLMNPYTIVFWASVSTQLLSQSSTVENAIIFAAAGVIMGTFAWVAAFNTFLHFTRNRLSQRVIHALNIIGGVILIGFAIYGFTKAILYLGN
jgi:L-lysine exporter family protein LysE/ArgO